MTYPSQLTLKLRCPLFIIKNSVSFQVSASFFAGHFGFLIALPLENEINLENLVEISSDGNISAHLLIP